MRIHTTVRILEEIAPDPGVRTAKDAGVEVTNVERPLPPDDGARSRTRREQRIGHVLMADRFDAINLRSLRDGCRTSLRNAGLDDDRTSMFVTAINECLTNAIRHGGGHGQFILIDHGATLVAEIIDPGPGVPAMIPEQPPAADALGGRGLWLVQRMVDRMTLTTAHGGTTLWLEVAHASIDGDHSADHALHSAHTQQI